ncbi:unnamed protein product [Linum tenue]|uniref:SGNH hydrolase-type esterase domain-containing protein n=1 Tax=Linum tenue TaxID=586396 RepID=A0AAV0ME72_9ROSI|nr:unnamed protein product [Linum tenue]
MRPKIYLFGDSITEMSFEEAGWGASLTNHFARTADVVLRGYSGYNTRWALKVAERVFPAAGEAVAVTVFFGANDACLPDRCSAFQHVPLEEECGSPVIDLWAKMQQLPNWPTTCLSDGLHLSVAGNKVVFEEVVKKLEEVGVSLQTLPSDQPLISHIDAKDPLKSFPN